MRDPSPIASASMRVGSTRDAQAKDRVREKDDEAGKEVDEGGVRGGCAGGWGAGGSEKEDQGRTSVSKCGASLGHAAHCALVG